MVARRPICKAAPRGHRTFADWVREHPLAAIIGFVSTITGIPSLLISIWATFFVSVTPQISAVIDPATIKIQDSIEKSKLEIIEDVRKSFSNAPSPPKPLPSPIDQPHDPVLIPPTPVPTPAPRSEAVNIPKLTLAKHKNINQPTQHAQPTEAPLQTASVPPTPNTIAIVAPDGSIPGNYQDRNAVRELSIAMSGSLPFASQKTTAFRIEISHVDARATDTMRPCPDDPRYSTWQGTVTLDMHIFSQPQDTLIFAQTLPGSASACGPEGDNAVNASLSEAVAKAKEAVLMALHNRQQADLRGQ